MNPQALLSAVPWARRLWKVMPPALRAPVLLVGAGVAVWYALEGREELKEQAQLEAQSG
jgi:hypothetical protein